MCIIFRRWREAQLPRGRYGRAESRDAGEGVGEVRPVRSHEPGNNQHYSPLREHRVGLLEIHYLKLKRTHVIKIIVIYNDKRAQAASIPL